MGGAIETSAEFRELPPGATFFPVAAMGAKRATKAVGGSLTLVQCDPRTRVFTHCLHMALDSASRFGCGKLRVEGRGDTAAAAAAAAVRLPARLCASPRDR